MITTEDPSGNGIKAYGLFDLVSDGYDLSPRLHAGRTFIMIAGKTPYKKFETARNYAWHLHGEPLFMRLYLDAETGKWNYHDIFPFYRSRQYQDAPGAVELDLQQVTAIVNGGRQFLNQLLKGEVQL